MLNDVYLIERHHVERCRRAKRGTYLPDKHRLEG